MTDRELQRHVEDALGWEPSIDAADIGVTVEGGIVALRGDVSSHAEKAAAERVALHVYGARAVANDLNVHLSGAARRTDPEIAEAAVTALRWNSVVPHDRIAVSVSNGWITLAGDVEWQYQRYAAARSVRDLVGVRGVTNNIAVHPVPHSEGIDIRHQIEEAFKRAAEIDARRIAVTVHDGKVILMGNVRSTAERDAAERVAWAAPGITQVDDLLSIAP